MFLKNLSDKFHKWLSLTCIPVKLNRFMDMDWTCLFWCVSDNKLCYALRFKVYGIINLTCLYLFYALVYEKTKGSVFILILVLLHFKLFVVLHLKITGWKKESFQRTNANKLRMYVTLKQTINESSLTFVSRRQYQGTY